MTVVSKVPKYTCSISEECDDDVDAHYDDQCRMMLMIQLNNIVLLIVSRGVYYFCPPPLQGGYPLRLKFFQDLHTQLVR